MNESFRNLHHVCVVVKDLDASVEFYDSIGVGPWEDFPSLEVFRNRLEAPSDDFFTLRYKYANLGDVQLQLCEPPVGDSPQRKFLDAHGEGVFHIGFAVPDVNDAEGRLCQLGLAPLMRARLDDGSGFTYFDTANRGAGVVLEIRASGGAGIPR